jgi:hypothetical protein
MLGTITNLAISRLEKFMLSDHDDGGGGEGGGGRGEGGVAGSNGDAAGGKVDVGSKTLSALSLSVARNSKVQELVQSRKVKGILGESPKELISRPNSRRHRSGWLTDTKPLTRIKSWSLFQAVSEKRQTGTRHLTMNINPILGGVEAAYGHGKAAAAAASKFYGQAKVRIWALCFLNFDVLV